MNIDQKIILKDFTVVSFSYQTFVGQRVGTPKLLIHLTNGILSVSRFSKHRSLVKTIMALNKAKSWVDAIDVMEEEEDGDCV